MLNEEECHMIFNATRKSNVRGEGVECTVRVVRCRARRKSIYVVADHWACPGIGALLYLKAFPSSVVVVCLCFLEKLHLMNI